MWEMVMEALKSFGFPVVVAGALFWYINKKDEQHREEVGSLRTTIEANTDILHELKALINAFLTEKK